MTQTTSNWAYASLLAGGLLIIVGGLAGALMMGAFNGMMGYGMMRDDAWEVPAGWFAGMAWWMGAVGVLTGGTVLFAAYRLRKVPDDVATAGTLAIVGGALSLLSMGGWVLGAALALLGGILALGGGKAAPSAPPAH